MNIRKEVNNFIDTYVSAFVIDGISGVKQKIETTQRARIQNALARYETEGTRSSQVRSDLIAKVQTGQMDLEPIEEAECRRIGEEMVHLFKMERDAFKDLRKLYKSPLMLIDYSPGRDHKFPDHDNYAAA